MYEFNLEEIEAALGLLLACDTGAGASSANRATERRSR